MRFLTPDVHFPDVYCITPDYLNGKGIKALVFDIDNTLVTYGTEYPTDKVKAFLSSLSDCGFGITIASNNHENRVDRFCRELNVFYTFESGKPSKKCVRLSCEKFGIGPGEVAVVGDQLFTDVWCAKNSGAFAIHVTPLKCRESSFIRFKRVLERPILKSYRHNHPEEFASEEDQQ